MKRQEVAAIVGAYSRQGFSAESVPGGFMLTTGNYSKGGYYSGSIQFRTAKEARKDTGVNFERVDREVYRAALNFDLR